jgi:CHAT domain-containing protein/tetratricopeptide (TPR) repeat protein
VPPDSTAANSDADITIKRETLLATADARLGHKELAHQELREARALAESTRSRLQGEVLRTEGGLAAREGKAQESEFFYRQSLAFAEEHHDTYLAATNLSNLGIVALKAGHIDEALARFNAASERARGIRANYILQAALGNAGWAYYDLGDFDRALDNFHQAKAQAHDMNAAASEALWLQSEGLSLYRLGELEQARARYEQALREARAIQDHAQISTIETSLGKLSLQLRRIGEAELYAADALKEASAISDKSSEFDASILSALAAALDSTRADAASDLLKVHDEAAKDFPAMLYEIEDALGNLYAHRHDLQAAETWHRRAIRTYESQRAALHDEERRLPFYANGDELYHDYAAFLIATKRPGDALRVLDSARAAVLKEGLGSASAGEARAVVAPESIARQRHAVLLFYSLGAPESWLWAIDARGPHLFPLPPAAEIAAHIKSYQAIISKSRDPLAEQNQDAVWLYGALVAPAEALLPGGSHVFVIPDGPLNGFNLETLLKPSPQGLSYWLEDVRLTTASSLQLLARSQADTDGSKQNLLLLGDALPSSPMYPPLSHAAEEAAAVEQSFASADRKALTQAAAIPAAYAASRPAEYSYVHFVAHGTASSLRPLDSAIVLSPPPTDPDAFKLYARDIVHQPLHARLVTISACYGSGLRNFSGEGLVGLSWAFLRAGAHQVIGALWEVNDSSTPQLMAQLYQGLSHGEPPDDALRAAKLTLLHSHGVFRKPLYWGAFQLYTGA